MNRNLQLASLIALSTLASCDDKITQAGMFPGGTSNADGGGDGGTKVHVVPPHTCSGACCPTDPACEATPNTYSGPECLAQFDNTNQDRWQLRQVWSQNTLPIGNTPTGFKTLADTLAWRSQLNWPACNMNSTDLGTFIQLVDFDLKAGVGRVGFAKWAPGSDLTNEIGQGLCMVEDVYDDTAAHPGLPSGAHLAANMTIGANWPSGLPAPMMLPFNGAPIKAKQILTDFDYAKDRSAILAKFAQGGEYQTAGYTGIFYLNTSTGYLHGFGPVAYIVVYDTATQVNFIPIREGEITAQINDHAHPNCVGVYRGDALDPSSGCKGDTTNPAWGCPNGECPVGQGPNVTKGYFLITELEQVYNGLLSQTICHIDASKANAYGTDTTAVHACREWPGWDPTKADNAGLPKGDWCAETNGPATDTCHDAFRNVSYASFQGFRIQANTCTK